MPPRPPRRKGTVATLPASRPMRRVGSGRPQVAGGVVPPRSGCGSWVWCLGGVPWLLPCLALSVSCRSCRWSCVRLAVGSRPGAVPPWVCPGGAPACRCRVSSRWSGFPRPPPQPCSPVPGVVACRLAPVFAPCAGWSSARARPGACPCRSVRACRRAARVWPPWWPPAPLAPRRSPWPLRWPPFPRPRPVAGRFFLRGVPCLLVLVRCRSRLLVAGPFGCSGFVSCSPGRARFAAGRCWCVARRGRVCRSWPRSPVASSARSRPCPWSLGLDVALSVFAAGLAPGCAPWSPWPRCPGVLLVACPSRLAAEHCRRRAAWFGLAAAGPLPVSCSRWLVAVAASGSAAPVPFSGRFGAGPSLLAAPLPLPGVPLPVPPRGGSSRSSSRSVPAVSLRQGQLF